VTAIVWLSFTAFLLALLPALLYLRNRTQFRPPPEFDGVPTAVSVLIPARNEERSIGPAVESVLASHGVELEVIVLDDHSTDRTAAVVQSLAQRDPRVRLESAPPLPPGWCGKQHACFVLSQFARHPILMFLDADVRLTPDAVGRMAAFLQSSKAGLVSGFPRQETETLLEQLIIPLINWLLMCYLPMGSMRRSRQAGLGTGCGQWFATTREAYDAVGGHEAVKASRHDGIKLPRAYRKTGYMTDICDATDLAVCRMYRSAGQVWNGLAKNAREGLGAPGLIWVWTMLLFGGHIFPFLWAALIITWFVEEKITEEFPDPEGVRYVTPVEDYNLMTLAWGLTISACVLSYVPRLAATVQFRASWLGAVLHPLGILLLLAIQWYATVRAWLGRPVGWKGRPAPSHV
jgi:cellulose synthase/poly-beta-1,6-N-acetylglucosamine synthase-like glycosyltransferase